MTYRINLTARRWLTLSIVCGKKVAKAKRSNLPKKSDVGFPPHFEEKLRGWKRLLELEQKARSLSFKSSSRNKEVCQLRFRASNVHRNIHGFILELKVDGDSGKATAEETLNEFSVTKKTPVMVAPLLGDEECASSASSERAFRGVILGYNEDSVFVKIAQQIHLVKTSDLVQEFYAIERLDTYLPHICLMDLLENRKQWKSFPGYKLLLYAYRAAQMPVAFSDPKITLPKELNTFQHAAIRAAMNPKRSLIAIHGPPGTGKTRVITEIIVKTVVKKQKILVAAPSHKALMNVMQSCARRGLQKYCKIYGDDDDESAKYLNTLIESHPKYSELEERYRQFHELNMKDSSLNNETAKREKEIRQEIASEISVLFTTVQAVTLRKFLNEGFRPDLVIIDEAAQCMECEAWPILFQAPRAIVVGDHNQLSAITFSSKVKAENLSTTMMEYLCDQFDDKVNFVLGVQYRSNECIHRWSSSEFYDGKLTAHSSCANIHLRDLITEKPEVVNFGGKPPVERPPVGPLIDDPLVLVDTDMIDEDYHRFARQSDAKVLPRPSSFIERRVGVSVANNGEALLCARHISALVTRGGLHPKFIGCITPYLAQTRRIASYLPSDLRDRVEISSVDGFQGQERQVIVMSLVRNNRDGLIGFLDDIRRMNVAITRARRQFFLVASGRMMAAHPSIERLYDVIHSDGRVLRPSDILLPKKGTTVEGREVGQKEEEKENEESPTSFQMNELRKLKII